MHLATRNVNDGVMCKRRNGHWTYYVVDFHGHRTSVYLPSLELAQAERERQECEGGNDIVHVMRDLRAA